MSHPAITVSVNRSVFTTAGQTSGWKVHVSRWTTGARLGMMAAPTWRFCLVPPCFLPADHTHLHRPWKGLFCGVGMWLLSFTLKQLCAYLFSDRASGQNLQALSLNSYTLVGPRPPSLFWFCDVYSTSHWFSVTLAVAFVLASLGTC